jgi:DedD protein
MPVMPSEPTAEQVEFRRKGRQRLIGAIALALVAVVFVPMLLDPEPRRERVEPLLAIPPKDGAPPLVAATRVPEPAAQPEPAKGPVAETPAPAAASPPPAAAPEPPPEARKTVEPKSAEFKQAAPRTPAAKADAKPAPPEPRLEGFAVQVGAFKDESKLAQARAKVAAARLPHYAERLVGESGDLTRLRAGPFPTREAADKAAAQLKSAGLDARVVPLP